MKNDLEKYFIDTLMERPYGFSVGEHRFYIYPFSLGKGLLLQRVIGELGILSENLTVNASAEVLRVVKIKRDVCLRVIAYATCNTKEELFDESKIKDTLDILADGLDEEDVTTLLLIILTGDKVEECMKEYEIDKENERMRAVLSVKKDKNTLIFGGKSIYGSTVDIVCKRYGWTMDYVVWGISYANIRMLIADYVKDVHLTDDEKKKVPAHILNYDDDVIMATKENMNIIRSMDWR